MSTNKCLTIAEVCQMRDGEWVNEGVIARVSTIENKTAGPKAKKPGSKFWVVTLVAEDGPENVELSLFFAPKFREGDLIELTGKGIKFTQNNYGNKLSIGQETEITVVSNATRERAPAPRSSATQDDSRGGNSPAGSHEPTETKHSLYIQPPAGVRINGQTVGMAMKESLALLTKDLTPEQVVQRVVQPAFWEAVHEVASDVIRVSLILEAGKLAKPVKERAGDSSDTPY